MCSYLIFVVSDMSMPPHGITSFSFFGDPLVYFYIPIHADIHTAQQATGRHKTCRRASGITGHTPRPLLETARENRCGTHDSSCILPTNLGAELLGVAARADRCNLTCEWVKMYCSYYTKQYTFALESVRSTLSQVFLERQRQIPVSNFEVMRERFAGYTPKKYPRYVAGERPRLPRVSRRELPLTFGCDFFPGHS